jgi:hypothetical protein
MGTKPTLLEHRFAGGFPTGRFTEEIGTTAFCRPFDFDKDSLSESRGV